MDFKNIYYTKTSFELHKWIQIVSRPNDETYTSNEE